MAGKLPSQRPRKAHTTHHRRPKKGKEGAGPWCPSCRRSYSDYGLIQEVTWKLLGRYHADVPDHFAKIPEEKNTATAVIRCGYCNNFLWTADAAAILPKPTGRRPKVGT